MLLNFSDAEDRKMEKLGWAWKYSNSLIYGSYVKEGPINKLFDHKLLIYRWIQMTQALTFCLACS